MAERSELNETVYADASEVPDEGFRDQFTDEAVTNYLIAEDSETVGFLALREGEHPSRRYSRSLRVLDLAVDEDTGIAESVARPSTAWRRSPASAGATTSPSRASGTTGGARRFYRDAGFRLKQVTYARPLE